MAETISKFRYSWVSLHGQFDFGEDEITFRGYTYNASSPAGPTEGNGSPEPPLGGVGKIVSDQRLTDGIVNVDVRFDDVDPLTTAEVILHHNEGTDEMVNVGLGAGGMLVNLRHWTKARRADLLQQPGITPDESPRWNVLRSVGDRRGLTSGRTYHLEMKIQGAYVTVNLDGVEIGSGNLPFQLSGKQVGLFCQSKSNVHFKHFRVVPAKPLAFVVMQFDPPEYEELFHDVIVPVCEKSGLEPFRASQTYFPGLVIADIQRQIRESRVVIAEITPVNPNVYYEVGYADAIGKPVILIADGGKLEDLPFDVRAFRTLFYENTIGGKKRVEKTLKEFLSTIMGQKTWPPAYNN